MYARLKYSSAAFLLLILASSFSQASAQGVDKTTDPYNHLFEYVVTPEERGRALNFWNYYSNDSVREREAAIGMIDAYIEDFPNSPLLPELYFRAGTLYSSHANPEFNENVNFQEMRSYYAKAVEAYGGGWSRNKQIAWSSIANLPETNYQERVRFYRWLLDMRDNMEPSDVYPAVSINRFGQGRDLIMSMEVRTAHSGDPETGLPGVKQTMINPVIEVSARNIVRRLNLKQLQDLAQTFKGEYIAEVAEKKIQKIEDVILDEIDSSIGASPKLYRGEERSDSFQAFELNSPEATLNEELSSKMSSTLVTPDDRSSHRYIYVVVIFTVVLFFLTIYFLWKKRIRSS